MTLPVLSLHVPWAPLCLPLAPGEEPVKRIHTTDWKPAAKLIGQRLGIASTKQKPVVWTRCGDYRVEKDQADTYCLTNVVTFDRRTFYPLPLGHLLGTVRVVDCVPIVANLAAVVEADQCVYRGGRSGEGELVRAWPGRDGRPAEMRNISDQLPYGDFTPGRFAWIFADAKLTTEMCPACAGFGDLVIPRRDGPLPSGFDAEIIDPCPTCEGKGTSEPIPVKGRQKVWPWTP